MALILCPECGREISDAAAACPNCGFPLDRLKKADVQVVRTVTPAAPAGETILVRRRGFALAAAILAAQEGLAPSQIVPERMAMALTRVWATASLRPRCR